MNINVLIVSIAVVICFIVSKIASAVKKEISEQTLEAVSCIADTTLDKMEMIIKLADSYVTWAKQFKSEESGERKMELVIEKLAEVASKFEINLSEDDHKAITQRAYNMMENK